jgi:pimeloyl-ACP methyl ester carboxylesterase
MYHRTDPPTHQNREHVTIFRTLLTTIALGAATLVAPAPAQAAPNCQPVTIKVSIPSAEYLAGTLCRPAGRTATTVQLLVPGGYYGQQYWTVRGDPRQPSYVETMVRAGYATLAIDRLGTGKSSRPPSQLYQSQTHRDTVHQVIQQLRTSGFRRVVFVGHSFSSALSTAIAVAYPHDLDRIIYTGAASKQNEEAFGEFAAEGIIPANEERRFRHLDNGYATTKAGARAKWMTYAPGITRANVAFDELTKQPDVLPGYEAIPGNEDLRKIKVPVLIVVGQHDRLMCGGTGVDCFSSRSLYASENRWYSPEAHLETFVLADSGHSLNLHRSAPQWIAYARSWLTRH